MSLKSLVNQENQLFKQHMELKKKIEDTGKQRKQRRIAEENEKYKTRLKPSLLS